MPRLCPAELNARQDYTGLVFDEISLNLSLLTSESKSDVVCAIGVTYV